MSVSKCDALLKDWPSWIKKVFTYSKVEAKSIRECLVNYDAAKETFLCDQGMLLISRIVLELMHFNTTTNRL